MNLTIAYEALKNLYSQASSFEDLWQEASLWGYVTGETKEPEITNMFSIMYKHFRIKAKHKGVSTIRRGNPQYLQLEEVVTDAMVFCKEFSLGYREGFFKYLSLAQEMGWLKLSVLRYKGDKISDAFSVEREILEDPHEDITFTLKQALSHYNLVNYAHPLPDQDNPYTHVHFVRAAKVCHRENVSPSTFINKIGEIWSWTAQPLEPKNLYSKFTQDRMYLGDVSQTLKIKKVTLMKGAGRYD